MQSGDRCVARKIVGLFTSGPSRRRDVDGDNFADHTRCSRREAAGGGDAGGGSGPEYPRESTDCSLSEKSSCVWIL